MTKWCLVDQYINLSHQSPDFNFSEVSVLEDLNLIGTDTVLKVFCVADHMVSGCLFTFLARPTQCRLLSFASGFWEIH